jgi:quinohemoprotein amine dehydrogenase
VLGTFVFLGAPPSLLTQCIPVKSELIRNTCGVCHHADSAHCMSRISYQRKTPEGWEDTVRRMGRMNGVPSSASQAREIIRYLANNQGLAPTEVQGVADALERRTNVQEKVPDKEVKDHCTRCHSYARIAGQRRSRNEWLKLKDFHLASFPEELNSPDWVGSADKALNDLAERFPLDSPDWERNKGHKPPGKSAWAVRGHEPGRGDYIGMQTMEPAPGGDYRTTLSIEFADGEELSGTGEGIWYGGFAWRGRAQLSNGNEIRQVLELSPDGIFVEGRWFIEQHPEIGGDEQCYLDTGPSAVLEVLPKALSIPALETKITILGINLPSHLQTTDVNLGEGTKVDSIEEAQGNKVVVRVSVLPGTSVGPRNIQVGRAVGKNLMSFYTTIGYIRVLPESGGARMGGVNVPKQLQQFEAVAYSDGPDGIAGTEDDFEIGAIHARWHIENYNYTFFADDKQFVGTIDQNGLFTPSVETPNPKNTNTLNNAGSVWVVASYTEPGKKQRFQGRAYLLVAFPIFVKHDMP